MSTETLKQWFLEHQRPLPWREDPTPYRVWVSEVMLQQTQASVVVPYFLRWMERFPTISSLASAPLDDVIKTWEGLGYYSRARNLHAGAKQIVSTFNGHFPNQREHIATIKGIGPYTLGAIASFAFHQKVPAVDGNVLRVMARYHAIEEDIQHPSTRKKIHALTEQLLPDHEPWIIMEALIELGATVCQKQPQCAQCPLKGDCRAFHQGKAAQLPIKITKTRTEKLYRTVVILQCGSEVLIRRGQQGEVMHDLHEFPYFEAEGLIEKFYGGTVTFERSLPEVKHSFTRFLVTLSPVLYTAKIKNTVEGYAWKPIDSIQSLAFSSGHRKVLHSWLHTI